MTKCWIITEQGLKGTENQCIALAEAAGLDYTLKPIRLRQPWKAITPWVRHFAPLALAKGSAALQAPWPEVVIVSGRKAIAAGLWVKRQSGAKLVVVQSPVIKDKAFDLVIVPRHDHYHGLNVLPIAGALSVVTPATLALAQAEWVETLGQLPGKRVAVLIGGTSRTHQITNAVADRLIEQLKSVLDQGFSLMVTASRRTPKEIQDKLRAALSSSERVHFFDGTGPNPYQGYLAWADAILVTEDSVSMASEAINTGKPVYIVALEGGSIRFKRFHDHLVAMGWARRFEGAIESWAYIPPDDLGAATQKVKNFF